MSLNKLKQEEKRLIDAIDKALEKANSDKEVVAARKAYAAASALYNKTIRKKQEELCSKMRAELAEVTRQIQQAKEANAATGSIAHPSDSMTSIE